MYESRKKTGKNMIMSGEIIVKCQCRDVSSRSSSSSNSRGKCIPSAAACISFPFISKRGCKYKAFNPANAAPRSEVCVRIRIESSGQPGRKRNFYEPRPNDERRKAWIYLEVRWWVDERLWAYDNEVWNGKTNQLTLRCKMHTFWQRKHWVRKT